MILNGVTEPFFFQDSERRTDFVSHLSIGFFSKCGISKGENRTDPGPLRQ